MFCERNFYEEFYLEGILSKKCYLNSMEKSFVGKIPSEESFLRISVWNESPDGRDHRRKEFHWPHTFQQNLLNIGINIF